MKKYAHFVIEIQDYCITGILNFIGITEMYPSSLKRANKKSVFDSESSIAEFFPQALIGREQIVEKNDVVSVFLKVPDNSAV